MDKVYLRDLFWAIKAELIRLRFWAVGISIFISFLVLLLGIALPKKYTTTALLYVDITTIIDSSKNGELKKKDERVDRSKDTIYTRAIIEAAAKTEGLIKKDMLPEKVEDLLKSIRSSLSVKSDKNNPYAFRVSYDASNPDVSFDMLNNIVNEFISSIEKKKREESSTAYNFTDAQVQSYKKQLEQAEEKLKEFNSQNVDGTEATVSARIAQLNTDIQTLKITIEESQSKVNTLQQQLGNEGQYQHTKSQVDDLKRKRSQLVTVLEQLLLTYQEGYPDIVAIRAQIAELDANISKMQATGPVYSDTEKVENPLYEEIRKQLAAADLELKTERRRMESLNHLLDEEKQRAERVAANKAEFSELTRDYDVIRKNYEEMLQKKETARLSMTLDQEGQGLSYRIQEPATFPLSPSGLDFIHFAVIGPIIGILLPILLVIMFVMFDPNIRMSKILQEKLPPEYELLGVIPHYHSALGARLLKKDMLGILAISIIAFVVYLAIAIYWNWLKG